MLIWCLAYVEPLVVLSDWSPTLGERGIKHMDRRILRAPVRSKQEAAAGDTSKPGWRGWCGPANDSRDAFGLAH
jgi:hypothetical protein